MIFSIIITKFLSECLGIVIFSLVLSGTIFKIYLQVFSSVQKNLTFMTYLYILDLHLSIYSIPNPDVGKD